jgi:1-acyl-sn-glycerol-3-phosphate acyltransferase
MSKVLGDDPFGPKEDEAAASPVDPGETQGARPGRRRKRPPDAATTAPSPTAVPGEEPAPPGEPDPSAAPAPGSAEATSPFDPVALNLSAATTTPGDDEDAAPDALPPDESWSDVFYGEEAAPPPPGEYGPSLDKRKEIPYTRQSVTEEVRELERRVRARLTPAFPIERRRRLPFEGLWRRYRDLAMQGRSEVVDELGRDPLYAEKVMPILEFLYSRYFRVSVEGAANIPEHGRAILCANHSGTLPYDALMLMMAVRKESAGREVRPLVEDFVFHFPYLGVAVNRIGAVRACQENAERLLARDQLIAVFPEGIKGMGKLFRERYRLQRFGRGGFIKLALRTGSPIIPAAIIGAEEIHPLVSRVGVLAKALGLPYLPVTPTFPFLGPLGLLPLPTKWTIRLGKPLDYAEQYGPGAADDRILVNKLGETVRAAIQEMIDEALSQRKSILFG